MAVKTLELQVKEGTSKEGRKYTYCDLLADDVQIVRMFVKPTEYAFYAEIVGTYQKVEKKPL